MKYDYHIIVIGAGSAGLVVASGAAKLGAKVALIEKEKMGGDCLNTGCIPSKAFLRSAHLAKEIANGSLLGVESKLESVDLEKVMNHVQSIIKEIEPHDSKDRYEALGVDVLFGKGVCLDAHTVQVGDQKLTAKKIVLAMGSGPVIPDIEGIGDVDYLTNENVFELKTLPEHLVVLGGGSIGLELGQGFQHLGSNVTIINRGSRLFKNDDPEVGPLMGKKLKDDGLNLMMESVITKVEKSQNQLLLTVKHGDELIELTCDQLLIASGRRPQTAALGLESVGVEVDDRGYVVTNDKMQSSVKSIYACGDVTGPYQFTHTAGYQASIVLRNTIFRLGTKVDYSVIPWTTYTKPEVAHVGYTEPTAKSKGVFGEAVIIDLSSNDRAKIEEDRIGFLKLIINKKGRIIGATLVGDKAGEMIPLATLAIKNKQKPSAFLNMIFAYPSESEIFLFAALKVLQDNFKDWQKRLIKTIFLR